MSCLPNVAQQVACFGVELSQRSDVVLEARGNSTLLVADGNHLKVYTFKGELVASFQDHLQPISALCVVSCLNTRINTFPVNRLAYNAWVVLTLQDSFRVVTASRDLSLRVLTWRNDPEHGLTLESQYHLLGGSFTRSRYSGITRTDKWCSHVLYFDRYFLLFFSVKRIHQRCLWLFQYCGLCGVIGWEGCFEGLYLWFLKSPNVFRSFALTDQIHV